MGKQYVCVWLASACAVLVAAGPRAPPGELKLFAPTSYDLETTVLLNDVARNDKEISYKIMATLDVAPVWSHLQTEFLLRFQLRKPELYLRGKHVLAEYMPYDSVWDSYADSTFYAHWKNGVIQQAYLDPDELVDIVNYKKSLASLFQFQVLDGEYNETDVSGPCSVLYESISLTVFRKIKLSCAVDGGGAVAEARRVARYTLRAELDALDALYSDELVALGDPALGLKARTFTRLGRRAGTAPVPAPLSAADVADAVRALPPGLKPLPLTLTVPALEADEDELDDQELVREVAAMGAALEAEAEDAAAGAAAALRVLPALRAAPPARLAALLARDDVHPHLASLCRALGLAARRGTHAAARDFLALESREPLLALAHTYLDAVALAHQPDEWVVLEVLRLGEEARVGELGDSALLAAAAAAAPVAELSQTVRDTLARSLARCKDEECRAVRLAALGNLRRADTADLLLEHAARAARVDGGAAAALAALDALGAAPPDALTFARLDRLTALALDERAPFELRGAALDLLVARRAPVPAPLAAVAHHLHARADHELRRVLWQRMATLAPDHDELRRLPSMLEPVLRGWDAQAHDGTSSVLVRPTGWAGAGWRAELESVQLARGGLLRRGAVTLRAQHGAGAAAALDALSVRVWTRGLEAFGGGAGAESGADEPAEEAAGGLAISVAGARMRDIALFNGQAELLGHVWAGTASEPTPVMRALRPLRDERTAVPLQAGTVLRATSRAALALALDAQAQVSLWYRSARAELELRGAALLHVRAELRPAWGTLSASAEARAAPRLRIGADLDFYSAVALCVRARTDAHWRRRSVTLQSQQSPRQLRVRRVRREAWPEAGRTLALGRANDRTCCTLRAADDDAAPAATAA